MTWSTDWWKSVLQNRIFFLSEKKEDSLRDFWNNIKCTNIGIIKVPEGKEREKGPEKIFEEIIIAENFPNMGKEVVNQVQEAENPRKDKSKEDHTETHGNQTDKN